MIEFVVVFVAVFSVVGYVLLLLELGRQRARHEGFVAAVVKRLAVDEVRQRRLEWRVDGVQEQMQAAFLGESVSNRFPGEGE